jgi:RNA polymerase sigma-70 factor (ECF subfamily)
MPCKVEPARIIDEEMTMPGEALGRRSAESEWLLAARDGSLEAIGRLYELYGPALYSLAYRITGSRQDAEDVLQDVFVALPRALESYREQGQFAAWLKRIAARTALLRLRVLRQRRETDLDPATPMTYAQADRPVEWIAMERALQRLAPALRAVFVLKEMEGYSHAEIADLLGIRVGASTTRLSRAWQQLRKELGP